MTTVTTNEKQLSGMIEHLSAEQKFSLLLEIAESSSVNRVQAQQKNDERFRAAAQQRGLTWDNLTDEERIAFVDSLVHESR
ncbi:MAG: hypothetical protein HYZ34_09455 [Ignavibacteriae bacterium]|nr:hypothetical protein [Ignavibacteriota bacterium]